MRIVKRTVLRIFFCIELIAFVGIYFCGAQGMQALWQLDKETQAMVVEVTTLKKEVDELDYQILAFNSYDFYKEQVAREQLQMARADDEVYFVLKS